jgi:HEAT repeat protein
MANDSATPVGGKTAKIVKAAIAWAVETALGVLYYLGAWGLLSFGLASVWVLVHGFTHTHHAYGALSQLFMDNSRTREVLAPALVSFFAIHEWLSRRSRTWNARREWFPSSWLFLALSATLLVALSLFWLTEAGDFRPQPDPVIRCYASWSHVLLPATLVLGLALWPLLRFGPARFRWLAAAPVVLALAAGVVLAHFTATAFGLWNTLPPAWPTAGTLICEVLALAGILAVAGVIERCTLGRLARTLSLLFVGLWFMALAFQFMILCMFHDCMCRVTGPPPAADGIACTVIKAAWCVAVIARVVVYFLRRRGRAARGEGEGAASQCVEPGVTNMECASRLRAIGGSPLMRRRNLILVSVLLILATVFAGAWFTCYRPWSRWSQWMMPEKLRVHALINALGDANADVQMIAAYALRDIESRRNEIVPALIEALGDPDANMRRGAARALGEIRPKAKETVPALIRTLGDPDAGVRRFAALALGEMGPGAKEAVPALIKTLDDPDAHVRGVAAFALGEIRPEAKEAVPALMKALDDPDRTVRDDAAYALGKIGPDAKDAIPALIKTLDDKEYSVRRSGVSALGQVGPDSKEVVQALIKALRDPSDAVADQATYSLGRIGPAAKEAVPVLIEALGDPSASARRNAAERLGLIGPEAKIAVPELIKALNDPDVWVRGVAARALGTIGPTAKDAIPELERLAKKDLDGWVRWGAREALGKIRN